VAEGKAEKPETNETKRRLRKLHCVFPSSFPDIKVFELFTKPNVREFEQQYGDAPFQWTSPDMDELRRLLFEELGDVRKVDAELADLKRRLAPVDQSQAKLTSFYSAIEQRPQPSEVFQASSSKRLKKACEKLKRS
jgi:hypothetical protein